MCWKKINSEGRKLKQSKHLRLSKDNELLRKFWQETEYKGSTAPGWMLISDYWQVQEINNKSWQRAEMNNGTIIHWKYCSVTQGLILNKKYRNTTWEVSELIWQHRNSEKLENQENG